MSSVEKPSLWLRITVPSLLAALATFAAVFFVAELVSNASSFSEMPNVIVFEKAAYYGLGGVISVGVFAFLLIAEFWFAYHVSQHVAQRLIKTSIFGLVLMFLLPQVMHYGIGLYMNKKNYSYCESASRRWLHSVTLVYAASEPECIQYSRNIVELTDDDLSKKLAVVHVNHSFQPQVPVVKISSYFVFLLT